MKKNNVDDKRYERTSGQRQAVGIRQRTITFSWEKLDVNQGQTIKDWENKGFLSQLCMRMQQINQYETSVALAKRWIKQYTQFGFPPDSKFSVPKHVSPPYWAVMHITPSSKEVIAGYIEDDIFYIVFLDEDHHFWPSMNIQDRGKNKR